MVDLIYSYFPDLTPLQQKQFALMGELYHEVNEKVNVISRKDIDELYLRHVLHALAIAKVMKFQPEHQVLDVGTGGGFPGIPLAVMFPETHFHLVDSIGKKIQAVEYIASALDLENVKAEQKRAEKIKNKYHFFVSRAVTQMPRFVGWVRGKVKTQPLKHQKLANGILYLKGGDLTDELSEFPQAVQFHISKFYKEDFFDTKKVVYLPL